MNGIACGRDNLDQKPYYLRSGAFTLPGLEVTPLLPPTGFCASIRTLMFNSAATAADRSSASSYEEDIS